MAVRASTSATTYAYLLGKRSTHLNNFSVHYSTSYDLLIVGGGIVGLATAREIATRYPAKKIALVEKEPELARHQTGHNSGVIHAGIYYAPGSLKAKLCVKGGEMLYNYCDLRGIPYKKCGKVIVATEDSEVPRLQALYDRGKQNNVKGLRLLDLKGLKEIEPHCQGKAAIHSPHTGIVDYGLVTKSYAADFQALGGEVYTSFDVSKFNLVRSRDDGQAHVQVLARDKAILAAKRVITCCGLYSDRIAQLCGCSPEPKIVPFRGDYLLLVPEKTYLSKGNIYPVPDPNFPFLGVHFTPRMDGSVWLGPNAVFAFAREGYTMKTVNVSDLLESVGYSGLRKLAFKHWKAGADEMYRAVNLSKQVALLKKFVPELELSDVIRGPSGVRAQALDKDGKLVDDFVFDQSPGELGERTLHVRNAPSPAATSSLAIAEVIAEKSKEAFKWT